MSSYINSFNLAFCGGLLAMTSGVMLMSPKAEEISFVVTESKWRCKLTDAPFQARFDIDKRGHLFFDGHEIDSDTAAGLTIAKCGGAPKNCDVLIVGSSAAPFGSTAKLMRSLHRVTTDIILVEL